LTNELWTLEPAYVSNIMPDHPRIRPKTRQRDWPLRKRCGDFFPRIKEDIWNHQNL